MDSGVIVGVGLGFCLGLGWYCIDGGTRTYSRTRNNCGVMSYQRDGINCETRSYCRGNTNCVAEVTVGRNLYLIPLSIYSNNS